jgi:phenylpropionate dioxygenase-like ring-hydroxylating dioxygenase large terminal subunit
MRTAVQQELVRRFRKLRDGRTTDLGTSPLVLSPSEYTSVEQLAHERAVLFRAHPQVAALTADLPNPRDVLATQVDGVPVILVRGRDGTVRAFLNACRHRGAPVVEGRRSAADHLTCPFHAWRYDLEGRSVRQPLARGCFDVAGRSLDLRSVSCGEAHGVIFVRLDGEEFDAAQFLGDIVDDLDSFGLSGFHHIETRVAVQHCNWKMVIDTFIEAYHVFSLHRETISPLYYSHPMLFDSFGTHSRLIGIRRSIDDLGDDPDEWRFPPHATIHYLIYPNVLIVHQLDHFEVWRIFPAEDDPGKAVVETSIYAPEEPPDDRALKKWHRNLEIVLSVTGDEDFALCGQTQEGLASGAVDSLVLGRNEVALIHFHEHIQKSLRGAPLSANR